MPLLTDYASMIYGATGDWTFPTTNIGSDNFAVSDKILFNIGKPFTTNLGDALSGLSFKIGSNTLTADRYDLI